MAEVNPRVTPTNDPSYTRDSRAIDVPNNIQPRGQGENAILPKGVQEGDRSAAYVGQAEAYSMQGEATRESGFANLFSDVVNIASYGVKAADSMIKKSIENQVYDAANAEREQYTEALETIRNNKGGMQSFLNANASMDETPTELEGLGDTLSSMSGANQAGKMSNTMYYGRLTALAKDLRARYPGYREYIDQQFSSVTGVNPANAYITQLMGDINRNTSSATQQRNKALSFIQQNSDIPGASKIYSQVINGEKSMVDALDWAAPYHQAKLRGQMMDLERKNFQGDRDTLQKMSNDEMSFKTEMIANNFIQNMKIQVGADTFQGMNAFLQRADAGGISDQQARDVGEWIRSQRVVLQSQLVGEFAKSGKNGRSLTTDVGGIDNRNKIINESLALLDAWGDRIYNRQWGMAFKAANELEARQSDLTLRMVKDPNIGPWLQMTGILDKNGGQAATEILLRNALQMGLDKKAEKFYTDLTAEARAQTAVVNGGRPTTMLNGMTDGIKSGVNNTKLNQQIVQDTVKDLTSANVPDTVKENLAKFAYSDGNYGFIEKLNKDGVDSRGRTVPGQYITFRQMTSPEATKVMKKLGDVAPQAWSNYQNWAEVTFRNLFLREINDLNQLQETTGVKVGWDPKANQFYTSVEGPERNYTRGVRETVNRLNIGLKSMSEISSARGDSPEVVGNYLLTKMQQAGFKPDAKTEGFPQRMYNAIIEKQVKDIKQKQQTDQYKEDFSGRSNFSPEFRAPTVGEFVKDPTGSGMPLRGSTEATGEFSAQSRSGVPARNGRTGEAPRPVRNYSDEQLLAIDTQDIPADMSARDFLEQLRLENKNKKR